MGSPVDLGRSVPQRGCTGKRPRWRCGIIAAEWVSSDVPPCLAVDSCPGGHVADVEFGGQLPVSQSFGRAGAQFPYSLVCQGGSGVALADGAVVVAVAFPAPRLESAHAGAASMVAPDYG
jgi:hypothetical protein